MKYSLTSVAVVMIMLVTASLWAVDFKAESPVLLTSSGQSNDVMLVKLMLDRNKIPYTFEKLAKAEDLAGVKTLILVAGGSTKGLGAAKIDIDQELKRTDALIAGAKKDSIKIITVHIGGEARRGSMSDKFNKPSAEAADCLVVLKAGDNDLFFTKIAQAAKIPLISVEKRTDMIPVFADILSEKKLPEKQ